MMNDQTIVNTPETDDQIDQLNRHDLDEPKMYKVMLFNDDYTTFEFVIYILMNFFHKSQEEAEVITVEVHKKGQGVAGVFSYDEAETRKSQVIDCARKNDFPLMCMVEQI